MAVNPDVSYLKEQGVHAFVNDLVEILLQTKPSDFLTVTREFAAAQKRSYSKGGAGNKNLKYYAERGPEHIYREPKVTPTADALSANTVYMKPTRSNILPVKQRQDYALTVGALFAAAAAECKLQVTAIINECTKTGKKFFDNSFYYDRRRNMYPGGSPADCTVSEPGKCMRASELYPKAPVFSGGISASDIIQGAIGDCFYIGAVAALAACTYQSIKPIERLFAHYSREHGVYGVLFFKNGGWEWVIVDDYIAVNDIGKGKFAPLYACPMNEDELWPMIIEKAYAKMHFNWDTIDGGWLREALADLTGGLEYTLDLYRENKKTTMQELKRLCDDELAILGCAVGRHVQASNAVGNAGESGAVYGLFHGHAYSVLACRITSDGQGFLRVRNPWGNEAEWTGDYSDKSAKWKTNTLHFNELKPEDKDDGAFWIKWEDFKTYLCDVDVCKFFPDNHVVLSMFGESKHAASTDTDTFILKVASKGKINVTVTLGQEDPKTNATHTVQKSGDYAEMKLSVYKLTQLPDKFEKIASCLDWKYDTPRMRSRTLDHMFELEPGIYSLLPQISSADIGYYVRCFGPPDADIAVWRFKDGERSAMHVSHGVSAGEAVIAAAEVHVQVASGGSSTNVGPTPSPSPTPVPAAASQELKFTDLLKKLGLDSDEKFTKRIKDTFLKYDPWKSGRINSDKVGEAFRTLLCTPEFEPKINTIFKKYDKLATGRITQDDFSKLANELLTEWISSTIK